MLSHRRRYWTTLGMTNEDCILEIDEGPVVMI